MNYQTVTYKNIDNEMRNMLGNAPFSLGTLLWVYKTHKDIVNVDEIKDAIIYDLTEIDGVTIEGDEIRLIKEIDNKNAKVYKFTIDQIIDCINCPNII